eukprot:scaffold110925_cov36-Phaeocystis_antarctica.AAC.1
MVHRIRTAVSSQARDTRATACAASPDLEQNCVAHLLRQARLLRHHESEHAFRTSIRLTLQCRPRS